MNHHVCRTICLATLALLAGCGPEQPSGAGTSPSADFPSAPGLQQLSFIGVADPVSGRVQIVSAPQPFFGKLTEDANGSATTVVPSTVQVYGATSAAFTNTVPAGCTSGAATYMTTGVEVFSGFTEQLRNVYARIGSLGGLQTFCTSKIPSPAFTGSGALTPNQGLYRYQPLNLGSSTNFAIKRTLTWAMNLPDNGSFWFTGDLWAEVFPQPPTITAPTTGQIFTTAANSLTVNFSWTNDTTADGTNPENDLVRRPLLRRNQSQLTIYRCGALNAPTFVLGTCTTTAYPATSQRGTGPVGVPLTTGYWYLAEFKARFTVPPATTTYVGGLKSTQYFQVKH